MIASRVSILMLCLLPAVCSAQAPVDFTQTAACEGAHDPYGADSISVAREGRALVVEGWVGLNCGEKLIHPQFLSSWGTLTLSVETHADGPVASCRCTMKIRATAPQAPRAGSVFYLVKDGMGAAHAEVP